MTSAVTNKETFIAGLLKAHNTRRLIARKEFKHPEVQTNTRKYASLVASKRDFYLKINGLALQHGSPPLKWNEDLAQLAQQWADKLARQAHVSYCQLPGVGENITFFPQGIDAETAVEHWYAEHEKYEFETPGWQTGTNYFTQVVWKATEDIGVGVSQVRTQNDSNENVSLTVKRNYTLAQDGEMVVVAFYRPSGNNNRAGQFHVNVRKPVQLAKPTV